MLFVHNFDAIAEIGLDLGFLVCASTVGFIEEPIQAIALGGLGLLTIGFGLGKFMVKVIHQID